jgi:hypothetical protein
MRYFVAVNGYRTSTSDGFGNTWSVMECDDRKHQTQVLTRGLVVRDCQSILDDGSRGPCYSTMGIRVATAAEIREAKKQEEYGSPIQNCEPFRGVEFELVRGE